MSTGADLQMNLATCGTSRVSWAREGLGMAFAPMRVGRDHTSVNVRAHGAINARAHGAVNAVRPWGRMQSQWGHKWNISKLYSLGHCAMYVWYELNMSIPQPSLPNQNPISLKGHPSHSHDTAGKGTCKLHAFNRI